MCGISGFTNLYSKDKKMKLIKQMTEKITHRGPDDEGHYVDEQIALGMRRLSIIDLEGGKQPIFNENRSKVIVFNGEIYNYKELRNDLIYRGHRFQTNSDTETILHAYEEYGPNCLHRLNGMFAIAIWDKEKKEIFLARDRLGVKPLHYFFQNGQLVFGSEIKSILEDQKIRKKICDQALVNFLKFNYIPAPLTIFEGIYKLLPGHYLTYNINSDAEPQIQQYWDISPGEMLDITYGEAKNELYKRLEKSIEYRKLSEVPLGSFLSGGIDSGIITGLLAEQSSTPVNTFTIGYKDYSIYDESKLAREVANRHQTNHHELFMQFNDLPEVISKIVWALDEPFADPSVIPTYYVSEMTRKYVTVALSGDGGDELFAGYNKYTSSYYASQYNKLPKVLRGGLLKNIVNMLPSGGNSSLESFGRKAKKLLKSIDQTPLNMHIKLMESFSDDQVSQVLKNKKSNSDFDIIKRHFNYLDRDNVTKMMYTDLKFALPNGMLTKVDKMSMINSLEARTPFLDYNVVEFAYQLPIEFKMKRSNRKLILKDTFKDLLPESVLNAPKKGFGIPLGEWFKKELRGMLEEHLSKKNVERVGIFNYNTISEVIQIHKSGKQDYTYLIWNLLVFHIWFEEYMA